MLANRISTHFHTGAAARDSTAFRIFDELNPIVTVKQNFDDLLTPAEHVSRKSTDTFYVDDARLLRCHMTAHQPELLRAGHDAFLMLGDVFRRDEIDATHYPVFHQVDGVRVFTPEQLPAEVAAALETASDESRDSPVRRAAVEFVVADLKHTLESLVRHLFGDVNMRWIEASFPFTDPSLELEIFFEGAWLEVLGCGMIKQQILRNCGRPHSIGWAFGMGLERLAMVMHSIPDIRLFWSTDPRFLEQFGANSSTPVKFKPYSKFPACYKDITFWLPTQYHENDMYALVREVAGDMVERVQLLDKFSHPKTSRTSHCYRILYRHMDRSLTNKEVDALQETVRKRVAEELRGELR